MEINNVVVIGGGIAAHTAALYTSRASLNPIVISGIEPDQLSLTTKVENYPGFPEGILGPELVENCKKQAIKFGAKYIEENAESFSKNNKLYEIKANNQIFKARTVIIATGASARTLKIPGEDKYFGRGISTCAVCDAALFRNKEVIVIGGGDSAMEESLALHKFANKITIIHRRDKFRASKIMQDRIFKLSDKISIKWNSIVTEVLGDGKFVTSVKIKDINANNESEMKCQGVFYAIGHNPNTKIFNNLIELDEEGYIKTDKRVNTNLPGVFAAGDVQDRIYKQAITSAGAGCKAAIEAEKYIENLKAAGGY
ncbi:MAG: thioredoxin-disulfide reductase [Nanoarchaeota archaeon]